MTDTPGPKVPLRTVSLPWPWKPFSAMCSSVPIRPSPSAVTKTASLEAWNYLKARLKELKPRYPHRLPTHLYLSHQG
jgi:hypothetical protein